MKPLLILTIQLSLALGLAGCGSDKGKKRGADPDSNGNSTQIADDQQPPPPPTTTTPEPAPTQPAPINDPFVGQYTQVGNPQATLSIDENHIVTSNISVPDPVSMGTYLIPSFSQPLIYDDLRDVWSTTGLFNDPMSIFRTVELRIRTYSNASLLDVTIESTGTGSVIINDPWLPGWCNFCPGVTLGQYQILHQFRYEKADIAIVPPT